MVCLVEDPLDNLGRDRNEMDPDIFPDVLGQLLELPFVVGGQDEFLVAEELDR